MKIEFRQLLLADAELCALAPGGVSWGVHPQSVAAPYITLTTVVNRRGHSLRAPTGPYRATVQADCYATSAAAAEAIANRAEKVLDGYRGGSFQGIFLIATRDLTGLGDDENEVIHRISLDFNVVTTAQES